MLLVIDIMGVVGVDSVLLEVSGSLLLMKVLFIVENLLNVFV